MNRRSSIATTLCGRLPCEMTPVTTPRRTANLRPPGYENYDSRLPGLAHSPPSQDIPCPGASTCHHVPIIPPRPGYTFGYNPHRGQSAVWDLDGCPVPVTTQRARRSCVAPFRPIGHLCLPCQGLHLLQVHVWRTR